MKAKVQIFFRVAGLACGLSAAALLHAQPAEKSYAPLGQFNPIDRISLSARAAAMGSADVGVADDASALFSNPAGLSSLERGEIGLHSEFGWLGFFQETALFGLPVAPLGGVALSVGYLTYGNFEGRDALGSLSSSYNPSRLALGGGAGGELVPGLLLGAALRYSQQTITTNTYSSFSPQAGVLFQPTQDWKAGVDFVYGGLGPGSGSTLSTLRGGLSWSWNASSNSQLLTAASYSLGINSYSYFQAGMEFSYQSLFFLRGGYQVCVDGSGYGGLSLGAGLVWKGMVLDYAYLPNGDLGDTHRFSLVFPLGSAKTDASSVKPATSLADPLKQGRALSGPDAALSSSTVAKSGQPGASSKEEATTTSSSASTDSASSQGENVLSANASAAGPPPQLPPKPESPSGDKESLTVRFNIPPDFTSQGEALEAQGDHDKAIQLFQQATQQDPQNARAWWELGNVYFKLKQKTDAISCFEKVRKLRPTDEVFSGWLDKYKK